MMAVAGRTRKGVPRSAPRKRQVTGALPPARRAVAMAQRFQFTIHATDGKARTGTIAMQRGEIRTPAFMPVGTAGTVKAMKPETVRATGADIILGNTYQDRKSTRLNSSH